MNFIRSLYLNHRFFWVLGFIILMFIFSFVFQNLIIIPRLFLWGLLIFTGIEILLLFTLKNGIEGSRYVSERLSNGDDNKIRIDIFNKYGFKILVKIIDELPIQFQIRDWELKYVIDARNNKSIEYKVRPVKRGEYNFGNLNGFVSTHIGLISKKYIVDKDKKVAVYPSYIQMQKYELQAISNRIIESGIKKVRKIGRTLEFDHIRKYVRGDDIRVLNWKATARRNRLMINQYQDEKSQNVYNVVDMGRTMKMPFEGMSLLDYAINTSLAISNIAIKKEDKAGLITFSNETGVLLPAARRNSQMNKILELLYKQETNFLESDFEKVTATILHKVTKRSLILFYTNFETLNSMKRRLFYLREISKRHLLILIFFKNTELNEIVKKQAKKMESIYKKTVVEKFIYEKKQIIKELSRFGIHSILTEPSELSINTINKYLEIKAKGLI